MREEQRRRTGCPARKSVLGQARQATSCLTIALATTLALGAAERAAAQDVKVQVQIAIPRDLVQLIQREVLDAVRVIRGPGVGHRIREVIREATGGFAGLGVMDLAFVQNRNFTAEQVDRQTKTLALGATGALDLKNVVGDISVTAGSGRDVVVEIVRTSRGRTDADAKLGLSLVTADVTQRGDHATVQSHYPEERNARYSVSIAYNVTTPAGTSVTIASIASNITAKDVKGTLAINVVSGDINVSGGKLQSARTKSGNVTVSGTDTDGTLEMGTYSGSVLAKQIKARRLAVAVISGKIVVTDSACDSVDLTSTSGSIEYGGPLSKNGRYDLRSHVGQVRFTTSGAVGYELEATTFSGEIRTDVPVQVRGTPAPSRGMRRSIHGTVGDGSATVTISTFNGDVTIGKK